MIILELAARCLSPADSRKVLNYIRDAGSSMEMQKMAVKSIGQRMSLYAAKNAKKPEDKLAPTNVKSKIHQLYFNQALRDQSSPVTTRLNRRNRKRKAEETGTKKGKKGSKKKKKGRALEKSENKSDTKTENGTNCKSNEKPAKYDWNKVPKGLKSINDLPETQKSLLEKQFEKEGIEYDLQLD